MGNKSNSGKKFTFPFILRVTTIITICIDMASIEIRDAKTTSTSASTNISNITSKTINIVIILGNDLLTTS